MPSADLLCLGVHTEIEAQNCDADSSAECTEAGCSGNHQSDNDEPMSSSPETEHMCVLVYGGFSGDAVEGDLISIDPGKYICHHRKVCRSSTVCLCCVCVCACVCMCMLEHPC